MSTGRLEERACKGTHNGVTVTSFRTVRIWLPKLVHAVGTTTDYFHEMAKTDKWLHVEVGVKSYWFDKPIITSAFVQANTAPSMQMNGQGSF